MRTDTLFYELFQLYPVIFFELIGESVGLAEGYSFQSVELKQTAFRIDGVFLPEESDGTAYFCEVQFQEDPQLYYRFFAEVFLFLRQFPKTHNWRGLLLYPSRRIKPSQSQVFHEFFDSGRVTEIFLDEWPGLEAGSLELGLVKLVVEPQASAPTLALGLIERAGRDIDEVDLRRTLIDFIETIIVYKFTNLSREEIEKMLGLSLLKETKVYQEALEEGRQEGRQEGRLEGRQEGRQEGQRGVIEALMVNRFGALDSELMAVVDGLVGRPSDEFMNVLLTESREALIDRFCQ